MRRVIVSNLMSLDGYFEGPHHEIDWFSPDEEFFEYARQMLLSVDTILFGRATYEHMAAYWPHAPADAIEEKMNGLAKIVFSRTLGVANWNNSRLVRSDAGQEIAKLKQEPGRDMVILGSAKLASSLLEAALIDEYRVILKPIVLGAGHPLFRDIHNRVHLKLARSQTLGSGVIILYLHPA